MDKRVRLPAKRRNSFSATMSRLVVGLIQPHINRVSGFLQGLKRPVCRAEHLPASTAEVKNTWSYTATPPYVFIEWYLVKHKDNLPYLTLLYVTVTLL